MTHLGMLLMDFPFQFIYDPYQFRSVQIWFKLNIQRQENLLWTQLHRQGPARLGDSRIVLHQLMNMCDQVRVGALTDQKTFAFINQVDRYNSQNKTDDNRSNHIGIMSMKLLSQKYSYKGDQ